MKWGFAVGFVLVVVFSLFCIGHSEAKSFGTIHIYPDGSVVPSSAPIQREGNTYRLLDDMYDSPIVLERNHIVFDGSGFTLEGAAVAIALNITCSNVTVTNLQVWNWDAGILGAYNNVTIQNCNLTGCGKGIAVYADDYRVLRNFISGNEWGIRLQGNNVVISNNSLVGNEIGVWVTSYQGERNGDIITSNTFETHGKFALETDVDSGFQVYHNNFIVPSNQGALIVTAYLASPGDESKVVMSPWDNGVEGNYWSNYGSKYPNASMVGSSGVYDTPYVINVAPNLTDRYPLVSLVNITYAPEIELQTPSPAPSDSPTPTPSLPTESPSTSPSPTDQSAQPAQTVTFPTELVVALLAAIVVAVIVFVILVLKKQGSTKT